MNRLGFQKKRKKKTLIFLPENKRVHIISLLLLERPFKLGRQKSEAIANKTRSVKSKQPVFKEKQS